MSEVFVIGGVRFDDASQLVVLTLPSLAYEENEITFHDLAGANYQVPSGYKLVIGLLIGGLGDITKLGRVGASDAADGTLTAEGLTFGVLSADEYDFWKVMAVIASDKYVTACTNSSISDDEMLAGTTVYGVLVAN